MTKPMTMQQFFATFPSDDVCLDHLFKQRFGEIISCPKCKKTSKFHRLASEKAYSCQWCGHHIHPMVGTPFYNSHTSLQRWYYAMYLFSVTRHGVSAKELQRQFGCSYKTAWRMGHKIREYMSEKDGTPPMDGDVEVDESYFGSAKPGGKRGRGAVGKTIVIGLQDRDGAMHTEIIPDVKRRTLHGVITEHVVEGSTVHTDELHSYKGLEEHGYTHKRVRHGTGEYANDGSHVNTVEAFWLIVKRSIRSTHVSVSPKHLPKYLGEFEYRQNRRKVPRRMFLEMLAFRPAS